MIHVEDSRIMRLFLESIKSESTRKQYNYHLTRFVRYYKLKAPESIVKIEQKKLQEMTEDYIMHLKSEQKSLSYHKITVSALEHLVTMSSDIILNWKKIRRLFPEETKAASGFAWSTEDIKGMLEATASKRNRAIILVLAASGVREGALYDLRLRHLAEMPSGCKSVVVYAGTKDEYMTFLTPEASKALDDYFNKRRSDGEYLNPESPVFRQTYQIGSSKAKPLKDGSLINMMTRILQKAGLRSGAKTKGRYEQQAFHSFRRRFNTILKMNREINPHLVEKMMGHNSGPNQEFSLDRNYLKPTKDVLFEEYRKGVADLTIDDKEKILEERTKVEAEMRTLEEKNRIIEQMQINQKKMREDLDKVIKRDRIAETYKMKN